MTDTTRKWNLSTEDIDLLRSLPPWTGPTVTGAMETFAMSNLVRLGLAVGGGAIDRALDDEDFDPRVWRSLAGDVLLATLDAATKGSPND